MNAEKPTREEVLAIITEILTDLETPRTLESRKGVNPAVLRAVVPLLIHAAKLAEAIVQLEEKGTQLALPPLARALFETGVTSQWVATFEDGLDALLNKEVKQRKALIDTALKSDFRDAAEAVLAVDQAEHAGPFRGASNASAQHFERMCEDFAGGANLYAMYRLMSGLAHPSVHVISAYLDADAPEDTWPDIVGGPQEFDSFIWLHATSIALLWAARAVSFLDKDNSRREVLRRHARKLGVPDVLERSEESHLRRMKDRKAKNG